MGGPQPTALSYASTSRRFPLSDVTEDQLKQIHDALAAKHGGKVNAWGDRKYQLWNWWTKAKHAVGIHTYIPVERWDIEAGSIQFMGNQCWICSEEAA